MRLGNGKHAVVGTVVASEVTPGGTILDFGCGACDKTALIAELGYTCYAFDEYLDDWHTPEHIGLIGDYARSHRIQILNQGALGERRYDAVLLLDVIEHFPHSPVPILLELRERLNPGGALINLCAKFGQCAR